MIIRQILRLSEFKLWFFYFFNKNNVVEKLTEITILINCSGNNGNSRFYGQLHSCLLNYWYIRTLNDRISDEESIIIGFRLMFTIHVTWMWSMELPKLNVGFTKDYKKLCLS